MTARGSGASGYILLEVLVTIVILVIGLLALAGLQLRTSVAETEAYQRAQALVLVQDMVDRMYANRVATSAADYNQDDIGTGGIVDCTAKTGAELDICEWANALSGASETAGGNSVGTLLGGRGCVTGAGNEYFVTVVWQGLVPTVAPAAACGTGQYGTDTLRRAVTMRVVISTLSVGVL